MNRGFLKIWRKIEDWEWINNPTVLVVWFHCLRLANIEDKRWQGIVVKRGSFVTGYKNLAKTCGLSIMQVRTALNKLKVSELTIKSTNKYSVISIKNYDEYNEPNKQITNKQQTNNKQITTTKEYKNIRNKYIGDYRGWLKKFNSLYDTKYRTEAHYKNYAHWRTVYSKEEMLQAIERIPDHNWLHDKRKPELILRQTDTHNNPVDRIGELLSVKGGMKKL